MKLFTVGHVSLLATWLHIPCTFVEGLERGLEKKLKIRKVDTDVRLCEDSTMRLKVPDPFDEKRRIARSCEWVARRNTTERCALEGVNETCPMTCGTCLTCTDSPLRFKFTYKENYASRSCAWTARKDTSERCAVSGVADTCRQTCDNCITRNWLQLGDDIDGESDLDQLGASVSLSNNGAIIAIGAYWGSGRVSVYSYDDDQSRWIKMGNDIEGDTEGDYTGYAVSLAEDGKTVAVGSPQTDDGGRVRVYKYDDNLNSWSQIGSDINGKGEGDALGGSVSLSNDGKTVAVGAVGSDGNGIHSGQVCVFSYNDNESKWEQIGDDINGENIGDFAGTVSLADNGKTVAIGASGNDSNGSFSGHVRVFTYNDDESMWVQIGAGIDGESAGDNSGWSVSLSDNGKIVAIGADYNSGNGGCSGHTRVYAYDDNGLEWVQMGGDIDGENAGDESGRSVSLADDGKTVAIGAIYNDGNGNNSGHVRVFSYDDDDSEWVQVGTDIDGEDSGDLSGFSVSLSGDGLTVAAGAPDNKDNGFSSGHARVYQYAVDL